MSKGGLGNKSKRAKGQFYTPTLFVDYAHQMISNAFGEDWKEKYVVWDNCSGTKNLTRDYYFKELYSSTLENAELQISERYNREGVSFQFDFLNDSLDKLPQGLKSALEENKPIIFFINPPYASANNMQKDGTSKEGVAKTMVNKQMLADKIGASSQNLYLQFLYRIAEIKKQYNLTDCHIGLFSPCNFLAGSSRKGFRDYFLNEFGLNKGVLFKASHFADVADNWGISFSIWNNGETTDKHNFNYILIDNIDGEIKEVGEKVVYNIDGEKTANDWAKAEVKGIKTNDAPQLATGVKINQSGRGSIVTDALGYFASNSNNVAMNTQFVALFSGANSRANGYSVTGDNFDKCVALFSARKLIQQSWENSQDEYLIPNTENEKYQEFANDSVVFSLFNSHSQQSSLRNIEYKGKQWDIKNEFFFMSREEMMSLANENNNDECYNDANVSSERYVYTKLQGIELSKEAQAVLDKARELVRKTFAYRNLFNEEHPEYQILNWDCGWYQIKGMLKEYMPNDLKDFNELFKALADKMRPMVYELGFLK